MNAHDRARNTGTFWSGTDLGWYAIDVGWVGRLVCALIHMDVTAGRIKEMLCCFATVGGSREGAYPPYINNYPPLSDWKMYRVP